jgi:hypothetical protein
MVAIFVLSAAGLDARVPLAMPGSTWGGVRFPSSQELLEKDNLILEGAVEQGVDWLRVPGRGTFNTFGRLEFKMDREKFDYNNKLQFEAGLKLRFPLAGLGAVEIGGKYAFDRRNITDRTERGAVVFVNWWGGWDLMQR